MRTVVASGFVAVLLHPLRSLTAVLCLVAVLVPYVAGTAVSRGVRAEARAAIDAGPDLHVVRTRFGRPAPLRLTELDRIRALPGVASVTPRIVAETVLGVERVPVVVVGTPMPDREPSSMPAFVIGAELARRLNLEAGSLLPPLFRGAKGDRIAKIEAVLGAEEAPSNAHVMRTSLRTAMEMFGEDGFVTDALVSCRPGYAEAVRGAIREDASFRVTSRHELHARLPQTLRHLDGIFQIHLALAFAVGIPLLLIASGIGLVERRREAALLKATGWMTDQLLVRAFVESLVLCAIGVSLAILVSWGWLAFGGGRGLAGIFLPGVAHDSALPVPYVLGAEGVLIAAAIALSVVATGTLYATWRVATSPVRLVLR